MLDVVALGELLIDFAPLSADAAGYPALQANPGGAPGNFLAALAACGKRAALLAKVGDDAFGRLLVRTLAGAGIETRGVRTDPTAFTTLAFVTLDAHGERSFSFARKPGADTRLTWDEVDRALLDEAQVFHFGSLSLTDEPARTATRRAVQYAKARGKWISFDPNLRKPLWPSLDDARAQILFGLSQADIVKLSDDELDFLWGCTPEEGARRLLDAHGVSLVMVTLGKAGCRLFSRQAAYRAACPPVTPVDTTGAGDIFGGSALSRLLELQKPPAALDAADLAYIGAYAVAAASLSTQAHGGIPSVPDPQAVQRLLDAL